MFTDTQRLFVGQLSSGCTANLISELLDKSGKALMTLFSPEDTTLSEGSGQLPIAKPNDYNISGLAKTVVWVALSISIALWIGRLG